MHKIDTQGATADNRFTDGDPAADIEATLVSADWLNAVQGEILAVVDAAGDTPDKTDNTQLRQAVQTLAANLVATHNTAVDAHADIRALLAGINIPQASETVAGMVRLSTAAQALAGTDNATAMSPTDVALLIQDAVHGYTRQQYLIPVVREGASGNQAVDLHLHQALAITATGNLVVDNPSNMTPGKTCVLLLYSASAQTISWGTAWHGTSLAGLPTALAAGKLLLFSFLCVATPGGTYMVPFGIGQEA